MTMMSKMGKISYVQLAVMLILCRVFASAMSFPTEAPQFGMQRFTVIVCAKILLCILFLPLFFIARKAFSRLRLEEARLSAGFSA